MFKKHTKPSTARPIPPAGEIVLADHQSYSLEAGESSCLACRAGTVWVTRDGDPRDYILEAGQSMGLRGEGRIIVFALGPARFAVTPCCGGMARTGPLPRPVLAG